MNFIALSIWFFMLMDAFGNIPIFLTVLGSLPPRRQRFVIFREMVLGLIAILLFYFAGDHILNSLQISSSSLNMSGGIILFIIALQMIFPAMSSKSEQTNSKEPFLVPLAIPLIAGPAVLASVLQTSHDGIAATTCVAAILAAWTLSTIILLFSTLFQKLLGKTGLDALTNFMGLILIMLAVQMFINGIKIIF